MTEARDLAIDYVARMMAVFVPHESSELLIEADRLISAWVARVGGFQMSDGVEASPEALEMMMWWQHQTVDLGTNFPLSRN